MKNINIIMKTKSYTDNNLKLYKGIRDPVVFININFL